MTNSWVFDLLRLFSFDNVVDLWWRDDDGELSFFVSCNDTFYYATADCEAISEEDLPALRQAKRETFDMDADFSWPILWVARKRGMRPLRAFYKDIDESLRILLDAAGPERPLADEG